jgi:hypothetical protein
MPKFYSLFFSYSLLCLCTSNAIANEAIISPIQLLLSEAGITEFDISSKGQSTFTPHKGYQALNLETARRDKVEIHRKKSLKARGVDKFHLDLGQDKERCEELERKLTDIYGPASSKRKNIKVWEIANPDYSLGQSKKITIMSGEEKGRYFLKMNRQGTQIRPIQRGRAKSQVSHKGELNRTKTLNGLSKSISD